MQKKKIILWVITLAVTHTLFFVGGAIRARQVAQNNFAQEFEKADAHIILGHYSAYRDIALSIQAAQDVKANCAAELRATAMFDSLKYCVENEGCKKRLLNKARQFAPEVLGEKSMPFNKRMSCP